MNTVFSKESIDDVGLEIELIEDETIWNENCVTLRWLEHITNNNNIRYGLYILVLLIMTVIGNTTISPVICLAFKSIESLVLITLFLECNQFIFKQSLQTFDTYYKTINFGLGTVAFVIDFDFYRSGFPDNNSNDDALIVSGAIMTAVHNTLIMLMVSNVDGYCVHKYIRFGAICVVIIYSLVWYYATQYFSYTSINAIGYVFGYPFHWHTLGSSCMTSALFFLGYQGFLAITKPDKLVFIPTFIPFNVKESSINSNININTNTNTPEDDIGIIINANRDNYNYNSNVNYNYNDNYDDAISNASSIDYRVASLTIDRNNTCVSRCGCHNNISRCLGSSRTFKIIIIYGILYIISVPFPNTPIIYMISVILIPICAIIPIFTFNLTVLKFILRTFVFWWKIGDVIVYWIMYEIEFKHNKSEASSKKEIIIDIVFEGLSLIIFVCVISSHKAIVKKFRYKKFFFCAMIVFAILYFLSFAIRGFVSTYDRVININAFNSDYVYIISCRTLLIEKACDLSLFLFSQLVSVMRFGFDGIQVTGYVTKKWKLNKVKKLTMYGKSSNTMYNKTSAHDDYRIELIQQASN